MVDTSQGLLDSQAPQKARRLVQQLVKLQDRVLFQSFAGLSVRDQARLRAVLAGLQFVHEHRLVGYDVDVGLLVHAPSVHVVATGTQVVRDISYTIAILQSRTGSSTFWILRVSGFTNLCTTAGLKCGNFSARPVLTGSQ